MLQRAKANDDLLALGSLKEMRTTLLALAKLQVQLSQELTVTVNTSSRRRGRPQQHTAGNSP